MPPIKVPLDETVLDIVDTSITWIKMSENLPPNNSQQKKVEDFLSFGLMQGFMESKLALNLFWSTGYLELLFLQPPPLKKDFIN